MTEPPRGVNAGFGVRVPFFFPGGASAARPISRRTFLLLLFQIDGRTARPVALSVFHFGSYAYNTWGASFADSAPESGTYLEPGLAEYNPDGNLPGQPGPHRESDIVAPSEMFAFLDSRGLFNTLSPSTGALAWNGVDFAAGIPSPPGYSVATPPQHGTVFNVVSCDAHVDAVRLSDLFTPEKTAPHWNFDHQPHPEY